MTIQLERAYAPKHGTKGPRFLVDRVWPRGVSRDALHVDEWLRDVAPSDRLRKWFGHDPARWEEFERRYFAELDAKADALAPLVSAVRRGTVTLLFGAKDEEHNNAVALRDYLLHAHAHAHAHAPRAGRR
jgi:uncharacterized protein YeaO (DUF488 family)